MTKLNIATTWRWAAERARPYLRGAAPIRPAVADGFRPTADSARRWRAVCAQWFSPAATRIQLGQPLYTARSIIAHTLRANNTGVIATRSRLRAEMENNITCSSDLRAAAKMIRHVAALHAHGLPAEILIITGRLHIESRPPMRDPNDDYSLDGICVQIIVRNVTRIARLVAQRLADLGIAVSDAAPTYLGLKLETPLPDRYENFERRGKYYYTSSGQDGYGAGQLFNGAARALRRTLRNAPMVMV